MGGAGDAGGFTGAEEEREVVGTVVVCLLASGLEGEEHCSIHRPRNASPKLSVILAVLSSRLRGESEHQKSSLEIRDGYCDDREVLEDGARV